MQSKSVESMSEVAKTLQTELHRRFVKYTSPGNEDHNPIMMAATALDPRYRVLLNPLQVDSDKNWIRCVLRSNRLLGVNV